MESQPTETNRCAIYNDLDNCLVIFDKMIDNEIFFYTSNRDLDNFLVIFDKMIDNEIFQYYAIRCQKRNLSQAMAKAYLRYPDLEIVYTKYRDPNSIKLYNLGKEYFKFKCHGNQFNTSFSHEGIKEELDVLYDEILYLDDLTENSEKRS